MAQTLSTLSIVFFILAAIFLILAVFFFAFFNIPAVVSYLTGRNVRKSIAEMRLVNEKTGKKSYSTSQTNYSRGKTTGKIQENSVKNEKEKDSQNVEYDITVLKEKQKKKAFVLSEETALLDYNSTEFLNDDATQLLDESGTELLDYNATQLLDVYETELLDSGTTLNADAKIQTNRNSGGIEMIEEIQLIHTDEVI